MHSYLIPNERNIKAIDLIGRMTYEAQNILRTDTLKFFIKENFNDIKLPNLTIEQVIEIVRQTLPQMDKSKMPITLSKENWVANYVITMFSIISKATSKTEIITKGSTIMFKEKGEEKIFEFDYNLSDLKNKIFDDLQNPSVTLLHLTEEESELFRRCSHAAYYFELELNQVDNKGLRKNFLDCHEKYFKS